MINYVYITTNSTGHTWEAILSAKSIKQNQEQSHVTIYTDQEPPITKYFDKITPIKTPENSKKAKKQRITCLIDHPEDQYVHLDSDTYVNNTPIIENTYSIAATTSTWRQQIFNLVPSVVIINKNKETTQALKNWLKTYAESNSEKDQYAFDEQVKQINHKILPPEYSAQVGEIIQVSGKIIISHCHWVSVLRNPMLPTILLNQSEQNRLWIPPELRMIEMIYEPQNDHKLTYPSTGITQEQLNQVQTFMYVN